MERWGVDQQTGVIFGEGEEALYDDEGSGSIGPMFLHALSVARRNLLLIAAVVGVFLVAGAAMTMLQTPKYTAEASLEIASRSDEVLGDKLDTDTQDTAAWDADRMLNSQLTVLTSRSLAERVAKRLNLYTSAGFFSAMQVNSDDFTSNGERQEAVLDLLQDNFTATIPSDTRIARIRFTSTDPALSAQVTNAFAEEFIQSSLQRRYDSSSYARAFVGQQLNEARARLEQSEEALNNYARSAGLIRTRNPDADDSNSSTSSLGSITAASLMQVNQATNEAQTRLILAEARWNAEKAQPLLSSPAALASPAVQQLLNKRSDLQAQLDTARDRYLGDHPTVVRLQSELKDVQQQLSVVATQAREAVRTDLVAARTAVAQLSAQRSALEGATMREQDRSVRYNTLAREADTNRSIYDGLLQRYRELNASSGSTASNISIIDEASPPREASSPHVLLNMLLALLIGAIAAVILVFVKDQVDDRIRVPEEVEPKLGLDLLGVIPQSEGEDPLVALQDPKSIISEAYSALRTPLLYSTANGLPKVMLVTSGQSGEGKSTTSLGVARSMASIGKRILLMDADLRRPSVHRLTGVENTVGLSSVLIGEASADQAIVPGSIEGLFVMPSGPVPPSPAELLSSTRLADVLDSLRESFDLVVIDSAPVLGLADAPSLSAEADGVLLVVEANRSRRGNLKAAIRRLRVLRPVILGVALTKFDPTAAGNAYSTYYQYDYYRYESEPSST